MITAGLQDTNIFQGMYFCVQFMCFCYPHLFKSLAAFNGHCDNVDTIMHFIRYTLEFRSIPEYSPNSLQVVH